MCPATGYAFFGGAHGPRPTGCGGHTGRTESSAPTSCHSEPVRAAKQVPLGYRLAWESVSPCLPLRGRYQREALTEGEMPRVFLFPSRLRRQPPPRGGLTARRCRADGTSRRRPLQNGTGRAHAGGQSRPPLYSAKRDGCRRLFLFSYTAAPRR